MTINLEKKSLSKNKLLILLSTLTSSSTQHDDYESTCPMRNEKLKLPGSMVVVGGGVVVWSSAASTNLT
jgi:hypothetical protein